MAACKYGIYLVCRVDGMTWTYDAPGKNYWSFWGAGKDPVRYDWEWLENVYIEWGPGAGDFPIGWYWRLTA